MPATLQIKITPADRAKLEAWGLLAPPGRALGIPPGKYVRKTDRPPQGPRLQTASDWRDKRAAGLCTFSGCRAPAKIKKNGKVTTLCAEHAALNAARQREYKIRRLNLSSNLNPPTK